MPAKLETIFKKPWKSIAVAGSFRSIAEEVARMVGIATPPLSTIASTQVEYACATAALFEARRTWWDRAVRRPN